MGTDHKINTQSGYQRVQINGLQLLQVPINPNVEGCGKGPLTARITPSARGGLAAIYRETQKASKRDLMWEMRKSPTDSETKLTAYDSHRPADEK